MAASAVDTSWSPGRHGAEGRRLFATLMLYGRFVAFQMSRPDMDALNRAKLVPGRA